ncbi:endonuclease/exonuclease/phosphatase family protein [Sulfitobacter aestuarii]|uniref:Endonuclease/exonuclease/phosphatase family protein n=1 Tax=Sulfitobacter aestuarii TaxID=2161676 RepID=A0ABW5U893_9RHOB
MAEPLRIASFNSALSREGPGLVLRDILNGQDPQVQAVLAALSEVAPDVIVLQKLDYDLENRALHALAAALESSGGPAYPHLFALPGNAGLQSGVDLDGDGRRGGADDAQGYGRFFGQGGMAILSRHPIIEAEVQDHSTLLWRDLPGALLPGTVAEPFPNAEARAIQRLSSKGHWVVPIAPPGQPPLHLLTFHATPPVFDGPQDRNGRRNHDEVIFWQHYLDGAFETPPTERFILLGDANLDPQHGDGRGAAIRALLNDARLQDPLAGRETVTWPETGPMRVDYLLPSADWRVLDSGRHFAPQASRHALIWVDLAP